MQKSLRFVTLVAVLSLSIAPTLSAETMGTNPKPQASASATTSFEVLRYVISYFIGF